jgi:hypothetical protein
MSLINGYYIIDQPFSYREGGGGRAGDFN